MALESHKDTVFVCNFTLCTSCAIYLHFYFPPIGGNGTLDIKSGLLRQRPLEDTNDTSVEVIMLSKSSVDVLLHCQKDKDKYELSGWENHITQTQISFRITCSL